MDGAFVYYENTLFVYRSLLCAHVYNVAVPDDFHVVIFHGVYMWQADGGPFEQKFRSQTRRCRAKHICPVQ